jgi:hypothetical protein
VRPPSASGLCIGVDDASTHSGAPIKQFRCDGQPDQQWNASEVEAGVVVFINEKSRKCMGVDHASMEPGADLRQFDCDGSESQKWIFKACDMSRECMANKQSGLCVAASRSDHDVQLEQVKCESGRTQAWTGF